MRNEGIGSWPARRARKTPHRIAVIHRGNSLGYAALHDRVTRLAHTLRARGVRPGDRVAYLGPNHPAYLEALFATGALGAVFVPLNPRLATPELAFQLADSGAQVLLHAPGAAADLDAPPVRIDVAGAAYEQSLTDAAAEPIDVPVALDDLCMIMYTSGTTDLPKGVMLSHANLTWNAVNVLVDQDLTGDERALVAAPLFHTAGLNMLALPVLLKGGTCVIIPGFAPDEVFDLIERHRITFLFGVPTMYARLAAHPRWRTADLSSLRVLTCGGAPVPAALIAAYQARGLMFLQGYGLTEASPGALFLDAEHAVTKAGSAGVPHFFTDARVVGPDLAPVAPGEVGEVQIRGPHVMPGYWGRPEASADAFADGWLCTGDLARCDDDGYVTIVDRRTDLIISGGENIYPAEVEGAILAHPDVGDCAVIGIPDDTWGEVGRAILVPRPGAALDPDAVLASLTGRLARYKIPKSVVVAGALPRTSSGKLLKTRIRELHSDT